MDKRICTIKSKDLLQFFILFQNLNEIQSKPTGYFTLLHFINKYLTYRKCLHVLQRILNNTKTSQ